MSPEEVDWAAYPGPPRVQPEGGPRRAPSARRSHGPSRGPGGLPDAPRALRVSVRISFSPLFPPCRRNGLDVQVTPVFQLLVTARYGPKRPFSFSQAECRRFEPDIPLPERL